MASELVGQKNYARVSQPENRVVNKEHIHLKLQQMTSPQGAFQLGESGKSPTTAGFAKSPTTLGISSPGGSTLRQEFLDSMYKHSPRFRELQATLFEMVPELQNRD